MASISVTSGDDELSVGSTTAILETNNNPTVFSYENADSDVFDFYFRAKYDDNSGLTSPAYTTGIVESCFGFTPPGTPFNSNITITGLTGSTQYWYLLQYSYDNVNFFDALGSTGTFTTAAPGGAVPAVDFQAGTTTSGTAPLVIAFEDLSTNTPVEWQWNFGDGTLSLDPYNQDPIKTYWAAGTYTVTLTATNANGSSSSSKASFVVCAPHIPVAAFTATPLAGPRPLVVQFTDSTTNSPTKWRWTLPSGQTINRILTTQNPSKTYLIPGTYTATLTAENVSGTDSEVKTSYITVRPIDVSATFTAAPVTGPAPLAVQFTGTPGGDYISVEWNFGDGGSTTTELNPFRTFYSTGTFSVTYTVHGTTAAPTASVSNSTATRSSFITVLPDPTYKEMLEELRRNLLMNTDKVDVCSDFTEWGGPATVLRYIYNRICRMQLEAGPLRKTSTTITATAPGVLTLPEDLIEIRSVYVNGVRLEKCDPRMADLDDQDWQTTPAGDYTGWYTNPGSHLTLNLVPAITPSTFEVYYVYAPAEPSVPSPCSNTWPTLPLPFVYWWIIKYGILADMLNHEGEMYDIERAQMCERMFAEGVELIKLSLEGT